MESEPANRIPIFPLPQVVLFPRVRVPLTIFEPRYREMTRDALVGDRRIGMVTVRPEAVAQMEGTPAVFAIGCEGVIAHSEQRPDGTYNLILEGTRRFRIIDELPTEPDRLYRVAVIERLEDAMAPSDLESIEGLRANVLDMLREVVETTEGDGADALPARLLGNVDHETVANALSQALGLSPLEKQSLLETDSIRRRFEQLADLLSFRLAELATRAPSREGIVH